MDILTREQILSADTDARATIDVPMWGGAVMVRALTGHELVTIRDLQRGSQTDDLRLMATVIKLAGINPDGTRLFDVDDVDAIMGKPSAGIMHLGEAIMKHSGLMDDEQEPNPGN